jgi:serine protease AprX
MSRACPPLLALLAMPALAATAPLPAAVEQALAKQGSADVRLLFPRAALPAPVGVGPAAHGPRAARVARHLQHQAAAAQAPLRAELAAAGIAAYTLWIDNSLALRADRTTLQRLAADPRIVGIVDDGLRRQALPAGSASKQPGDAEAEANLLALNVPAAWALGARGAGIVIGGQDTGVDWRHPALAGSYRGADGGHAHHWFDGVRAPIGGPGNPCATASREPCDDNGHGTHTLGTAVGDGGPGARIGVATAADWIACRNMDRGVGRPSSYLACFQFFLAPSDLDGAAPRPELAPHLTVNSWGCPPGPPPAGEDCRADSFDAALEAMEAAGILSVVAAGNGNAVCGSIRIPPSTHPAALVVGATDNSGAIAGFSLWGPAPFAGRAVLKPDLAAPGVAVRSALPGGRYGNASGTSMATPAVAGVAALMLGANPLLIGQPAEVRALLTGSALPTLHIASCGSFSGQQSPNAVFGHGRVDALAAVRAALHEAVTPAHSGAWFDPARDGEGWILQILDDGSASLVWYTYPPSGSSDAQAWLIASQGRIAGNRIAFERVQQVSGGRFGSAFDAAAVQVTDWGTLNLSFDGCAAAHLDYAGPIDWGSGQRNLQRLTQLAGLPCGQPYRADDDARSARSGAWFDPARSGEGWIVEALDAGRAALTWFSFDPAGRPTWLFGVGELDADGLRVERLQRLDGGRFGAAFDPAALRASDWGRLQLDFTGCDGGTLRYVANDPTWGSGEYRVQRLTRLLGPGCGP